MLIPQKLSSPLALNLDENENENDYENILHEGNNDSEVDSPPIKMEKVKARLDFRSLLSPRQNGAVGEEGMCYSLLSEKPLC